MVLVSSYFNISVEKIFVSLNSRRCFVSIVSYWVFVQLRTRCRKKTMIRYRRHPRLRLPSSSVQVCCFFFCFVQEEVFNARVTHHYCFFIQGIIEYLLIEFQVLTKMSESLGCFLERPHWGQFCYISFHHARISHTYPLSWSRRSEGFHWTYYLCYSISVNHGYWNDG